MYVQTARVPACHPFHRSCHWRSLNSCFPCWRLQTSWGREGPTEKDHEGTFVPGWDPENKDYLKADFLFLTQVFPDVGPAGSSFRRYALIGLPEYKCHPNNSMPIHLVWDTIHYTVYSTQ